VRKFLVWMLGWWSGFVVAGVAVGLLAGQVAGLDPESDTYALILLPAVIAGGLVGARLTRRLFTRPERHQDAGQHIGGNTQ
jgi:hypothetical protein